VRRIETRIAETKARGEPLRKDDDPEILKTRLHAYRSQTAPLIHSYHGRGELRSVDGMAPIEEVAAAIDAILTAGKAPSEKPVSASRKSDKVKSKKKKSTPIRKAAPAGKAAPKAKSTGRTRPRKARGGRPVPTKTKVRAKAKTARVATPRKSTRKVKALARRGVARTAAKKRRGGR
jgi:adenylate kinase